MIRIDDPVYTYDSQSGVHIPIEGKVIDIIATKDSPKVFDVVLEMNLPWDDGFWPTKFEGKYSPGATRTEGGSEYITIRETVKRRCHLNCYVYTDRIYNLQLCYHLSVLFVSNAKYATSKILKELRSLGQEPYAEDVETVGLMDSIDLK